MRFKFEGRLEGDDDILAFCTYLSHVLIEKCRENMITEVNGLNLYFSTKDSKGRFLREFISDSGEIYETLICNNMMESIKRIKGDIPIKPTDKKKASSRRKNTCGMKLVVSNQVPCESEKLVF
jgi:hypothetical protein